MNAARQAWRRAAEIRDEWLAHGLSTMAADRAAVEASLTAIYARVRRERPRFVWVDSPYAAWPYLENLPTHDDLYRWIHGRRPPGAPPLASDLAASLSRLRGALEECLEPPWFDGPPPTSGRVKRRKGDPWPVLPPEAAVEAGIPFAVVLRQGIRDALATRLVEGIAWPVRAALARDRPLPVPVHWYGQWDAPWVAHLDVLRRLELARYPVPDDRHFDDWATLARAGGWWWPGEHTCVVVERPAAIEAGVTYGDGWHAP